MGTNSILDINLNYSAVKKNPDKAETFDIFTSSGKFVFSPILLYLFQSLV